MIPLPPLFFFVFLLALDIAIALFMLGSMLWFFFLPPMDAGGSKEGRKDGRWRGRGNLEGNWISRAGREAGEGEAFIG